MKRSIFIVVLALGTVFPIVAKDAANADGEPSPPAIAFSLGSAVAQPDEVVSVDLGLETNTPLSLIAWSIEFDDTALELVGVQLSQGLAKLVERRAEDGAAFTWHAEPGEGWAQSLLVTGYDGSAEHAVPPGLLRKAMTLEFRVLPEAEEKEYTLKFTAEGEADYAGDFANASGPVYNRARTAGQEFTPENAFEETELAKTENGDIAVFSMIGDIGIFRLGDSNLDGRINLADAVAILDFLFTPDAIPPCSTTADTDDNGQIDLGDAMTVVTYLFEGGEWLPKRVSVGSDAPGCVR